jgi:hypothetical protein
MGAVLDGGQTYDTAILVLLAVVFVALALVVLWVILRKREGKR